MRFPATLREAWKKVLFTIAGESDSHTGLSDQDVRWMLDRLNATNPEKDLEEIRSGRCSLAERCCLLLCDGEAPGDAVFLERAYRRLLGREADEASFRGLSQALSSGQMNQTQVVNAFLSSAEFQQRLLLRHDGGAPSQVGEDSWKAVMRRDWDKRARENAFFYVDTCHSESEAAFERSGEWDLENHILPGIELDPGATALEIGCGIGRLMKPLARRVARVIGVDISGEMVRRARARMATLPNVQVHGTDGALPMLADSSVDFCYSYLVFQHLPAKEPAFAYFREVARVLRLGGVFRFQVNQRPERFATGRVADTWDGVGFRPKEVTEKLEQDGFEILDAWGQWTQYAWYTAQVKKSSGVLPTGRVRVHRAATIDSAAVEKLFERMGHTPDEVQRSGLLSGELPWRAFLEPLLAGGEGLNNKEFVSLVYQLLLGRDIDDIEREEIVTQLHDGHLSRSVFLDCLVSSREFREVLARTKG